MATIEAVLEITTVDAPEAIAPPVIMFTGGGTRDVTVTAESFIETATSPLPLELADISGADIVAFGCRDGEYVIESVDKTKKDDSGDYCLLARLNLRDVVLVSSEGNELTYSAVLTGAFAYDSYTSDPIMETRHGYRYLPTKHRRLSGLAPIQVKVVSRPNA